MRRGIIAVVLAIAAGVGVVCSLSSRHEANKEPILQEVALAVYEHQFHCTLYYTPRESGFASKDGFRVEPETRAGLHGHNFPRDFLVAIEKEGFGRLQNPVNGKSYIRYCGGVWDFAERALDKKDHPLVPKQSCAIAAIASPLAPQARLGIKLKTTLPDFERLRWIVADTGSGLERGQIDLYWGEDDPLGPGAKLFRPRSAPPELADAVVTVFK